MPSACLSPGWVLTLLTALCGGSGVAFDAARRTNCLWLVDVLRADIGDSCAPPLPTTPLLYPSSLASPPSPVGPLPSDSTAPSVDFTHFVSSGVTIVHGHEVILHDSFIGQYNNDDANQTLFILISGLNTNCESVTPIELGMNSVQQLNWLFS